MTQAEILLHYRLSPADVIFWSETHSLSSNRLVPQNMTLVRNVTWSVAFRVGGGRAWVFQAQLFVGRENRYPMRLPEGPG